MYLYSICGALVLWGRLGKIQKGAYSYADVIEKIFPSERISYIIQFVAFVLIGGLVAKTLTSPTTEPQALAAGMAWSRLVGKV
jgi:hypothetical protein